jgi:hypothetical protein
MVFRDGPLKKVLNQLLNQGDLNNFTFDVEQFITCEDKRLSEKEKFEWRYEDEIKPEGLELGFLKRPDRTVIISPQGIVIEFNNNTFFRWVRSLKKLPGIKELFDELAAKSMLPKKPETQ